MTSHEIEIERLRQENAALRADLDTLRNGVAQLGAERDRAQRWAALWKRAAKDERENAIVWAGAHAQTHIELGRVRRVARLLVAAWRQERQRADYWEGAVDLYRVALQRAREPKTDDATE